MLIILSNRNDIRIQPCGQQWPVHVFNRYNNFEIAKVSITVMRRTITFLITSRSHFISNIVCDAANGSYRLSKTQGRRSANVIAEPRKHEQTVSCGWLCKLNLVRRFPTLILFPLFQS